MNIEIHQPRLEALIQQRMASGQFLSIEDALLQALEAAPLPEMPSPARRTATDLIGATGAPSSTQKQNLAELFEPIRGLLTDEEVDTLFRRDPSPGRTIDLS